MASSKKNNLIPGKLYKIKYSPSMDRNISKTTIVARCIKCYKDFALFDLGNYYECFHYLTDAYTIIEKNKGYL